MAAHDHKTCIKTAPYSRRIKATKIQGNGNLTADHDKLSVSYQHWAIKICAYQFLSLPNCVTLTRPSQTYCKTTTSMCYNVKIIYQIQSHIEASHWMQTQLCNKQNQEMRMSCLLQGHWPCWSLEQHTTLDSSYHGIQVILSQFLLLHCHSRSTCQMS